MGREGTERLHANTCSMIIPPAESPLDNAIHHPAVATSADRGGGIERHGIVQIDRWLRNAFTSLLHVPELILINVVIGQQEVPARCLWPFRQGDKCQVLQVWRDRKMLIHILHITGSSLSVTALIHHRRYWLALSQQGLLNEIFHPREGNPLYTTFQSAACCLDLFVFSFSSLIHFHERFSVSVKQRLEFNPIAKIM